MFSSYSQLQYFTDKTRIRYQNGETLPWDYGLIELCEANSYFINEIKNIPKPFHNLEFKARNRHYGNILDFEAIDCKSHKWYNIPDDFAIAGGYALGLCSSRKLLVSTDIDIFPIVNNPDDIDYKHIISDLNKKCFYTIRTERAITGKSTIMRHEIQYILCPARTISELLYSFDIPICQIAIWKGKIYATYEWIAEAYSGQIFPNARRMSYNYHYRLKKYCITKGVNICYEYYGDISNYNKVTRCNDIEYNNYSNIDGSIFDIISENYKSIYYDILSSLHSFVCWSLKTHTKELKYLINVQDAKSSLNLVINLESFGKIWDTYICSPMDYNVCLDDFDIFKQNIANIKFNIDPTIYSITQLRLKSEKQSQHTFWNGEHEFKLELTPFPNDILKIILRYSSPMQTIMISRRKKNGIEYVANEDR